MELTDDRKRMIGLVSKKDYAQAISIFEALGQPDLSMSETKKIAFAYKKMHCFEKEASIYYHALSAYNFETALNASKTSFLRKAARSFMRRGYWRDAANVWDNIINRGEPDRSDLLALLGCSHYLHETANPAKILDSKFEIFTENFQQKEIDFLYKHITQTPHLSPGLYIVGGGNGTGKTTIGKFLEAIGNKIIDADTEVARYEYNGEWKASREDFGENARKARLGWPRPVIEGIMKYAMARKKGIILCGWSSNGHLFSDISSQSVYLELPFQERVRRLRKREPQRWQEGSRDYEALVSRQKERSVPQNFEVVKSDDLISETCRKVLKYLQKR